jgi:predicted kinase
MRTTTPSTSICSTANGSRRCSAPPARRIAIDHVLVLRHDWLVAVADADGRGRRCADPADQRRIVDACALWAEHARELGILDRAQAFASPHTRRTWCESPTRAPDVTAYDDTTCEVVVMAGLPAAGKDSWLAAHRPELPVISLDALRTELAVDADDGQAPVIAAAREQARDYLRSATSFAWNATNLSRPLRTQLLELFRGYRARTHVVYCETSADEQDRRNRARRDPVPRAVMTRMLERWTVPDPSEAHEVSYVVPSGDDVDWPPATAP